MWPQIAIMIAALLIEYALTPRPPAPKPAALSDFDFPQSTEGTPQAVILATAGLRIGWCWGTETTGARRSSREVKGSWLPPSGQRQEFRATARGTGYGDLHSIQHA